MNDRQLRSFVNAAELNSFTKAANLSYISTPALINQINTLEKDLNINLFNRNTHGIELTAEGRIFFEAAKKILHIYDDTMEKCVQAEKTFFRIGCPATAMEEISSLVFDFQKRHPEVQTQFDIMDGKNASIRLQELLDGTLSLICTMDPGENIPDNVKFIRMKQRNFSINVSPYHPLAAKETLTAEDLVPYEINIVPNAIGCKEQAGKLNARGIRTRFIENGESSSTDYEKKTNILLNGGVLLTNGINRIGITIPTDILASAVGFLIRTDASDLITDFLNI